MPHPVEPISVVKRREFSGESEAVPLVNWLNSKPRSKKKERVMQLLRALAESVRAQKATQSASLKVLMRAAKPHYRSVARLLARYRYVPDIRLTADGNLWSTPAWRMPRLSEPYDDRRAVWAIGRLCEMGRFRAIHACVGCGKWMFSKRTDNATCSAACRKQKERDQMPEWRKEQQRQQARVRYQNAKKNFGEEGSK